MTVSWIVARPRRAPRGASCPRRPWVGDGGVTARALARPLHVSSAPIGPDPASTPTAGEPTCSYALDAHDRITAVNAAWGAFAAENDGPAPQAVVGTSLWQHLADRTTCHLYGLLFGQVRASGRAVHVPYRCDAPGLVREMDLEIAPLGDRGLILHNRLVREVSREVAPLVSARVARSDQIVRMCGWCKRVEAHGAWLPVEEALAVEPLLCCDPVPRVSHGMCEACAERVEEELQDEVPAPEPDAR